VIAVIVAELTPVVEQSTISSCPTRCRSVIPLKTCCAREIGAAEEGAAVPVVGAVVRDVGVPAGGVERIVCGAVAEPGAEVGEVPGWLALDVHAVSMSSAASR
jgi:hypothetical protein